MRERTGKVDVVLKPALGHKGLQRRKLWACADQRRAHGNTARTQQHQRLQQHAMALLRHQSARAHQRRVRRAALLRGGPQHRRVHAKPHHLKLAPLLRRDQAAQLASAKITDAKHKTGGVDLLAQVIRVDVQQLFRPVNGKRPGHAPRVRGQHADRRDGTTEMDMQMLQPALPHPSADDHRFGQVQQPERTLVQRQARRAQHGKQAPQQHQRMLRTSGDEPARGTFSLHVEGLLRLCRFHLRKLGRDPVRCVDRRRFDLHPERAQAQNLMQEERVRDGRIAAQQVRDAHAGGRAQRTNGRATRGDTVARCVEGVQDSTSIRSAGAVALRPLHQS